MELGYYLCHLRDNAACIDMLSIARNVLAVSTRNSSAVKLCYQNLHMHAI